MYVEFADGLKDRLSLDKTGLNIAATYVSDDELLKNYLNRPYGNAYDFNQIDRVEGVF